jgi:plastocyanin
MTPRSVIAGATVAVVLAVVLVLGACSRTEHVVLVRGMAMDPAVLTVKAGDAVVFKNVDIVPHTATSADRFDSGVLQPQKDYRVTLSRPGEVAVQCTLHPTMRARIVVTE